MRFLVAVLGLSLCACATIVRDLEPGKPVPEGQALVFGRIDFAKTSLGGTVTLVGPERKVIVLRPEGETLLAAVPPGEYRVTEIGGRRILDTRPRFRVGAKSGTATYFGSLLARRNDEGRLVVVVRDEMDRVAVAVRQRFPGRRFESERGLIVSEVPPVEDLPPVEYVIALAAPDHFHHDYGFGIAIGFGFFSCYHHHYRHHHYGRRHFHRRGRR